MYDLDFTWPMTNLPKRVLVTGSSGFIGQHLMHALIARGDKAGALDRREISPFPGASFQTVCDMLDKEKLAAAVAEFKPDVILHLAARTDLDEKEDIKGYADNIDAVENLIEVVADSPSVKRCIYTSSQLVCRVGYVPESMTDYQPSTLYGQSKMEGEKLVRRTNGGGKEWAIVRPTTVWGPGMSTHYQRFFRMIMKGHYFHVGTKPLYKSYSFVGNIVHQYIQMMEAPTENIQQKILYFADYQPLNLIDWANSFATSMGARKIPTMPRPLARVMAGCGDVINAMGMERFPFNSFRLNNVLTEYQFDMSPTEDVCGPLPFTLDEGIRVTAAWFQQMVKEEQQAAESQKAA